MKALVILSALAFGFAAPAAAQQTKAAGATCKCSLGFTYPARHPKCAK